jgi:hypothetical protein
LFEFVFHKDGSEGGTRTHTLLPATDFKSVVSAISPLRHIGCSKDKYFHGKKINKIPESNGKKIWCKFFD